MEWVIEYILKHFLNGRELVIWGTGSNAFNLSGTITRYEPISFYISRDAKLNPSFMGKPVYEKTNVQGGLSSQKYYVVILADKYYTEIRDELKRIGFKEFEDFFDWFPDGHMLLPFDIEYRGIRIGKFSYFPNIFLYMSKFIGRFTSINWSAILEGNHQMNMIAIGNINGCFSGAGLEQFKKVTAKPEKVSIGNDVWIGANVFINASKVSTIGDGAIIGTNSLVLHDVPPYAIVYGTPARVQRYRFTPEQIEILLRVKWWEWDNETIDKNAELLIYPKKFFKKFG